MGANPGDSYPYRLRLAIVGWKLQLEASRTDAGQCLEQIFSAMKVVSDGTRPDLLVRVRPEGTGFRISTADRRSSRAENLDDLVYRVEKIATIGLQLARPNLLYLHAAALVRGGKAILLAGNTGGGKSTTTFGLLQSGFAYLSDELGPVCLETLRVHPYPHALCLKRLPPAPYVLPPGTLDLGRTLHVPAETLELASRDAAFDLGAVFLVQHDPVGSEPTLRSLSPAEATARLYVTGLNVLAHPDAGLPAVMKIAERVPCFDLHTADLSRTCELVRTTFDRLQPC